MNMFLVMIYIFKHYTLVGNQLMFNCDILKLDKCFDIWLPSPPPGFFKMTGKHQPFTGLMGLISLPLQSYLQHPIFLWNTRQTWQWPTVNFRPPEFRSSGSLSILCCSGTCPKLVPPYSRGTLNVPVKKASFPLSRGIKKITPQNSADLAVRSFLLSHLFRLVFCSGAREPKI